MAMQRVKDAAEKAKKDLSGMMQTQISLPYITAGANGPLHLDMTLTRAKFDELTSDLVAATETPVRQALNDADVTPSEIDQILLVGGSTRIIAVQESVKKKEISERHARALLKLEDTAQQNNMLKEILEHNLTVDETEKRIAKLLAPKKEKPRVRTFSKSVKIALNTINQAVKMVTDAGTDVEENIDETDDEVIITIKVKK